MSTQRPQPPEPLQQDTVEAKLVKQKIWRRLWRDNEHFMAVIVGREGFGKSYTGIKLAEVVDPTFDAERVMFDPVNFLKRLRDWKADNNTQGKMVVIDEAGVGVGVRTWYDKDQIRLNQVLQIIRDENMGVVFTIPRLEELDSQTKGRLHAFLEMMGKRDGEWAEVKWLDWDPTRDGRNDIYREYPYLTIDGLRRQVQRLRLGPPSDAVADAYEERKSAFQAREYEAAIDEMEEDVDDEKSVKDIAVELANGNLEPFISRHSQTGEPYINERLIRVQYETSENDAKAVKDLLNKRFDKDELEDQL